MLFDNIQIREATLPTLVATSTIPFLGKDLTINVAVRQFRVLTEIQKYDQYVVLLIPNEKDSENESSKYLKRAVVARSMSNTTDPIGMKKARFKPIVRCDVLDYIRDGSMLLAHFTTVVPFSSNLDEETVALSRIKSELSELNPVDFNPDIRLAITMVNHATSAREIVEDVPSLLGLPDSRLIEYLNEPDITKRTIMILKDVLRQKYFLEIDNKIDENVRESINQSQKEYYLREKMRAIQEELGEKAVRDKDIAELRDKLNKIKMNPDIKKKMLFELSRYESTVSGNPEGGIIRNYLDFVVNLPWDVSSVDSTDLKIAQEELDKNHYGLEKVKDRILEYLAVKIYTGKNPQSILCFVGPPGVGKTSLARSIANAMNKKFIKESLGGVTDESEIRGHRRTYLGALPGRILQGLQKVKTNNPVFLLDEIDKMSRDYKGDPTSAMLEVLDGEQNEFFEDHYLGEPFDLSHVFFIATANYIENIPAPLRDRMEIVDISSYTEFEKFEIAKRHLVKKVLQENGLPIKKFSITDQTIYKIIREYTREAGVRELERLLSTIVRKSIKNMLFDGEDSVKITVEDLNKYLGKPKFMYNEADKTDQIGCVNGLAYTEFGGDTLQIEVSFYPGTGKLLLTGSLGDVMKESCEAALSYVKANSDKFSINYELFQKNDIHIHVPEGATPKDGPSAGVTIATAIVSAFSKRPVNHLIGMTGEVTLRGLVLPIGGLKEKSIAASRSGLQTILIPKENERDIDEIPSTVKEKLKIIPISTIDDAIEQALK